MDELDFSGREQLYYQVYNILFQDIINGKYRIGERIPAESELMKQYHISRSTARKSMDMLVNNELVIKKQGQGTIVISNQPKDSPRRVVRYSKKKKEDHVIAVKKLIEKKTVHATTEIAENLKLTKGTPLICLKRVRYADVEPYYIEINYFEKAYVPEVLHHDFMSESLRIFLANVYHIKWSYAYQEIYSIVANEEMAHLLHVLKGSPLLYIKRISYDKDNIPREYVATYFRADKYHLEIELAI